MYSALENIDKITPILPGILERLRGMRMVHNDAAGVTGGIKELQERVQGLEREVKEWDESLAVVEGGLREVGPRVGGVVEKVEDVVLRLEGRVGRLEG